MTTTAEPGIVDTNVLVYALDTAAPQHAAARALLEAARAEAATLYVTTQILASSIRSLPTRVALPGRAPPQRR